MRRGNQAAGTQRISFCVALGAKEGTGRLCVYIRVKVCSNRVKGEKQQCAFVCFASVYGKSKCAREEPGGRRESGDVCERAPQIVNVQI